MIKYFAFGLGALAVGTQMQWRWVQALAQTTTSSAVYRLSITQDQGNLNLEIIAMDGRPLGYQGCNGQFSAPFHIQAGAQLPLPVGPLSSARRFDLLIRPRAVGTFPVQIEFYDWRATFTGSQPDPNFLYATARTTISVT